MLLVKLFLFLYHAVFSAPKAVTQSDFLLDIWYMKIGMAALAGGWKSLINVHHGPRMWRK